MIIGGYLKSQPVSCKVVSASAVRNPFQGVLGNIGFTGPSALQELFLHLLKSSWAWDDPTLLKHHNIFQFNTSRKMLLGLASPVSPVGSLLLHLATQLCMGARARLSVTLDHLWAPWHAQLLLPKKLRLCAASLFWERENFQSPGMAWMSPNQH